MPKKIAFFGIFERPFDTEVYIANSLKLLGHTVETFDMVNVSIPEIERILKEDFDFYLFSKGWFKRNDIAVQKVKESGKLTVGWFFDLTINTTRQERMLGHLAYLSDIVFTTDGGKEKEFKKLNINHKLLRQGIYEPEAYMSEFTGYKEEVVFLGTSCHDVYFSWNFRAKLLKWLKETYKEKFNWYGAKDGIRNDDLNRLCANTKVFVGDSVYSPHYWSNRLYEIIGRGGFLIFPNIPGIEKEFTPYEHFVPYNQGDLAGLKEKIDHYLENTEEREKIRKAGFEHCKKHHTYKIRCAELIKVVEEYASRNKKS